MQGTVKVLVSNQMLKTGGGVSIGYYNHAFHGPFATISVRHRQAEWPRASDGEHPACVVVHLPNFKAVHPIQDNDSLERYPLQHLEVDTGQGAKVA